MSVLKCALAVIVSSSSLAVVLGGQLDAQSIDGRAAAASELQTARRIEHAQPVMSSCAWPIAVNAVTLGKNAQLNVSNPDTAAAYWLMPFTIQDGLHITLSGEYPDSRYMSFAVYDSNGTPFTANGVGSTLADYRIAPDPGDINPWQHNAPSGGKFTVTLLSDVTPSQTNALPLAPTGETTGTTGVIFFRIYGLAHANLGQAPLPAVTVTLNGVSAQLPACPVSTQDHIPASFCSIPWVAREVPMCRGGGSVRTAPEKPSLLRTPGKIVPFARYPAGEGGTPDSDIAYLFASVMPQKNNDVLVVRAKAPTTPKGSRSSPWPKPDANLRYWSLCIDQAQTPIPVVANRLPDGKIDYGCRYDSQVSRSENGYYSFAIGTEAQRAVIERIPGVTFLPFSSTDPDQEYKLSMRNLIANPDFAQAIQNVPADGRPDSAETVMGPYYPRAVFCSLAILSTKGLTACQPAEVGVPQSHNQAQELTTAASASLGKPQHE